MLATLCLGGVAGADGGVEDLDASLPDASVGEGGADRDNPEQQDGRPVVYCRLDHDCDKGFNCVNGRCTWVGYRNATGGGCLGASGTLGLAFGLALVSRRRRAK